MPRSWIFLFTAALLLSSCNPVAWWHKRPLLPNARVEVFTPEGAPLYAREWRNKKRHGRWLRYNKSGSLKDESNYEHGKKHGAWRTFYVSGKPLSEGFFENDLEHGHWVSWYENGQKSFEGNYEHGKKQGKFYTWNQPGTLLQVTEWKDGVPVNPPETTEETKAQNRRDSQ